MNSATGHPERSLQSTGQVGAWDTIHYKWQNGKHSLSQSHYAVVHKKDRTASGSMTTSHWIIPRPASRTKVTPFVQTVQTYREDRRLASHS